MNRLLTLAVSTIAAVSFSSASAQTPVAAVRDSRLDGEWRGLAVQSSLNTQLALSLFKDGLYVRRMVIVTEFAWTAEPKILNIAPIVRKGNDIEYGQAMSVRMSVNAISLTTRYGKDSIVLYRLGPPGEDSSLIGRWQGESETGEEVVEEFAPDGQLLVMVTIARDAGRFNVLPDEIEWRREIPTEGKRREKFRMNGATLQLFVDLGRAPVELTRGPVQPP
ncbi:MAG TPA: hypothetical protein VM053_09585 [Gemmatimonadaceae bacterium]|nr:hypothetical protein [Gemmatimonadaceae bacterium]